MGIVREVKLSPAVDEARRIALFLDLDGTILDIATAPTAVTTPPDLVETLRSLQDSLWGAVAVLTGRKIAEVDRLLAPLRLPAAGVHGSEIRVEPDGDIASMAEAVPAHLRKDVEKLAESHSGTLFEDKGLSIAVHYRAVPSLEKVLEAELRRILDRHTSRLVLSHGRRVLELVPEQSTKGVALEKMMRLPPFRDRLPVMIGDDMPDETALAAAVGLGGLGLKVRGEHFRSGSVDFGGPADVRGWLHDLAHQLQA
jgi:trehalose 6-phosphate phosphatase